MKRQSNSELIETLREVLVSLDLPVTLESGRIVLADGIQIAAEALETHLLANEMVQTATSITAWHDIFFPGGLTEFQHAIGTNEAAAWNDGCKTWAQQNLVTLQDAIKDVPDRCMQMEANFPDGRTRQIILGPAIRHQTVVAAEQDEAHPFCPCCLFTHSGNAEVLGGLLESSAFLGIYFFVFRNEGNFNADCRINGEDFPDALPFLVEYAKTWPGHALEFRKQYVVLRDKPGQGESHA
ncbi:MAG: DUF6348 family protein [Zoogloeaceae bacterium]|jgi:hypothetical protein|nr:DUF6348 family protein [Zoogloeaceae bacterium]